MNKKTLNENKRMIKTFFKEFAQGAAVIFIFVLVIAYFSFKTMDDVSLDDVEIKRNNKGTSEQKQIKGKFLMAQTMYEDIYNIPEFYLNDDKAVEYLNESTNYNNMLKIFNTVPTYDEIKPFVESKKNIATDYHSKLYIFRPFSKNAAKFAEYAIENKRFEDTKKAYQAIESLIYFLSSGSVENNPYILEYMVSLGMKNVMIQSIEKIEDKLNNSQKKEIANILIRLRDKSKDLKDALQGEKDLVMKALRLFRKNNPVKMSLIDLYSNPFKKSEDIYTEYYNKIKKAIPDGKHYKQIDTNKIEQIAKKYRESRNPLIKNAVLHFKRLGEQVNDNLNDLDNLINRLEK